MAGGAVPGCRASLELCVVWMRGWAEPGVLRLGPGVEGSAGGGGFAGSVRVRVQVRVVRQIPVVGRGLIELVLGGGLHPSGHRAPTD